MVPVVVLTTLKDHLFERTTWPSLLAGSATTQRERLGMRPWVA